MAARTNQSGGPARRPEQRRRRARAAWRRALPMALALGLSLALSSSRMAGAILVQPHNYLLDDSALTSQHESAGSLSPFLTDAQAGGEQAADRDIASIIGDSWARLRLARMLDQQAQHEQPAGQLSQEMAELLESEQQAKREAAGEPQPAAGSLSSSMASMLLNVAQAAAASAADEQAAEAAAAAAAAGAAGSPAGEQVAQARPIMELDTSQAQGVAASAAPTKSDLKTAGPIQWYNPKETIPVLKISSMATPSKYKKVYFRSEKKLVDGAFHSPGAGETGEKKSSLAKALGQSASPAASVQRRSSRGSASSAPPSVLQDGVIDFLKKFRDVYVQTRPAGAQSASSSPVAGPIQFASSVMSAAASSPLASFLAPAASSNSARPNLMGALSTASQMVSGGAAMLSQAPANSAAGGGGSSAPGSGSGSSAASAAAAATTTNAANNANKAPLSAQSYVSFWSKTFPTWVRKMLKQMRRRSLYNSSKRQQQQQHHHHSHHHHHAAAGVSQKNAAVAASLAENAAAGGGGGGGASGSS